MSGESVRWCELCVSGVQLFAVLCLVGSAHSIGCDKLWTAREAMLRGRPTAAEPSARD